MGIEPKIGRNEGLKRAKLKKTRERRERLGAERRQAELAAAPRNDLLPELSVQTVEIAQLRSATNRTRPSSLAHVERHMASISRFGFVQPILIAAGKIIDGEARVRAGRKLGLRRVPAVDISHLSDAEVRTLRLAINRVQELGEWDLDQLRLEFLELIDLDVDLSDTGFSVEEQDIILLDPAGDDDAADEQVPEPSPMVVTRIGDIWVLGDHRVICGNALEAATYERLLQGQRVHLILTDPPYNVPIKGHVSGLGQKVHDEFVMASGELSDTEWQAFLDQLMVRLKAIVVDGAVVFVFMDWRSVHRVYVAGTAAGLKLINLVVWFKESGGMGSLYRSSHELLPVFCNGDKPRVNNVALGRHGRDRANTWVAPSANRRGSSANQMLASHATPKPVELCVDAILDVSNRGEVVLDAFLGSGTSLIACEKAGRLCRGIELDGKFVDVTIRRWQELTGREAVLAETGETFAEVGARLREDAGDADNQD